MNTVRKNKLTLIIGLSIIGFTTAIFFLLPYNKDSYDMLYYFCAVAAQTLSLIAIMCINSVSSKRKLLLSAGCYSAVYLYFIVSNAVTVLFAIIFHNAPNIYLIILLGLTVLWVISLIMIYSIGNHTAENNQKIEYNLFLSNIMEGNLKLMISDPDNSDYKKYLEKMYEGIRYSDSSKHVVTDDAIKERIADLDLKLKEKARDSEELTECCEQIIQLINKRNIEAQQLNQGHI